MLFPSFIRIPSPAIVALSAALCATAPVQEMSRARVEVKSAEEEKAADHSGKNFAAARAAMSQAHQKFIEDSYGDAKDSADKAMELALKARAESAPKYTEDQKKIAEEAVSVADEAYAEELAKDDFDAAKNLLAEGKSLHDKAAEDWKKASAKADPDRKPAEKNALGAYRTAYRKYQAARDAAGRARNIALAQKDDLLASVTGLEATLAKAESYGGAETQEYKTARGEVDLAKSEIQSGKLKSGNARIVKAEALASAAVAASVNKQAAKKLAEAREAVSQAGGRFDQVQSAFKPVDAKAKKDFKTLSEHMTAAREALASSEDNLKNKKYDESLRESDEAIKLAAIVEEQTGKFATVHKRSLPSMDGKDGKTKKDGKNGKDGGIIVGGDLPAGWNLYEVRRKVPADCLWWIAHGQYGNARLWTRIHKANRRVIPNADVIAPGQLLAIPPKEGEVKEIDPRMLFKKGGSQPGDKSGKENAP